MPAAGMTLLPRAGIPGAGRFARCRRFAGRTRLRRRTRSSHRGLLEAGNFQTIQRPFDQFFNVFQLRALIVADERNRLALHAGTTGSANAVNVAFGYFRHVEVKHMRHIVEVETTRHKVGSYKYAQFIGIECSESL